MTTDWSKTWAGANGWYDGYDDNTKSGSFVDISKLSGKEKETALASAREGMIGVLEQKGVTRAQILDPTTDVGQFYNTQIKAAEKGGANAMRDAFQASAAKKTSHVDYRVTNRGGKGIIGIVNSPRNGNITSSFPVFEGDEILISTNKGRVIRVAVKEIRTAGRNTQGVRIIKLSGEEKVVSAIKIDDNLI